MGKKFKLQSVLNYRQILEDQARQKLAESLQQKTRLEEQLRQQQQATRQLDTELKERQEQGLSVAEMNLFESQIQHRQRQLSHLQTNLQVLESAILGQREDLLQVARDRQVIEKLKEKREREYRQELSRKEREMLDEICLRSKGDMS